MREDVVLCAANAYHQKYYLNPEYGNLPEDVQKELKLIAVDYVEEIGGVFLMSFNADQKLVLKSMHEEDDLRFDDAKAQKKIDELATRYEALFTKLETYYQALETLHGRGKSSEEMTAADLTLFFAMAVNRKPRKITSSRNPTQSIHTTRQAVSTGV